MKEGAPVFSQKLFPRGLMASTALAGALTVSGAQAGGFINQSQSTIYNGSAYAGYAAPGSSPSAMFLNPATMTEFTRITTENNFSFVVPQTRITRTSGAIPVFAGGAIPSGDIGLDAFVPSSFIVIPLGSGFTFGASLNAPYGSATKPDFPWGGQVNSMTTVAKTYTFTPAIAYEISPQLSIGVGVQAQYMYARFMTATGAGPNARVVGLEGSGWSFGLTAGLTWKPLPGTAIGIGYRSRIDQKLEGDLLNFPGLPAAFTGISTTVKLPDRLNLSIRQTLTPQFDLLASVEWHNWSRIGVAQLSGPALANPMLPQVIPFNYRDAWFFALGGEYRWNEFLTLRGGMAYEISPITTAVRNTRLPDNDRFWLSAGLSYQVTERVALNLSYSHVFIKDAPIAIAAPDPVFNGRAKASADIFSIGFTTKWGSAPQGVLRQTAVVRK